MEYMNNNDSSTNMSDERGASVERIAERVGAEVFGKPCECRTREGLGPFQTIMMPEDGVMRVGLPQSVTDLPECIAEIVLREMFKAVDGDSTASPAAALNAAYHTVAESMADVPCFSRDPSLDDAIGLYIDAGLVPAYAVALVFRTDDAHACAMPLPAACSCALSGRLVSAIKASSPTYEEETRLLALAIACPLGKVMSGYSESKEGNLLGLEFARVVGIREEDFGTLKDIVNGIRERE